MKSLHYILPSVLIAVLSGLASCDTDGCEGNSSTLPLAGFYSSSSKSAISIDSITVYGIGAPGDSAIIDNSSAAQQVYLPFDVDASRSQFVIRYNQKSLQGIADTITIKYESTPYFHSKDCGAFYVFDVTDYSVSHNLIDSIQVPQSRIDNTDTENIKIYFRTSEADEQ